MQQIVLNMVQEGGGLSVDKSGKIYVDFDNMPTDKFEAMLKSIRVPIWLTADKNFYVNQATGSDTLDAGRGESAEKAFKTIQACVNYVCDNYNISRYIAIINVAAGTYEETLRFGSYTASTGYIELVGEDTTTVYAEITRGSLVNIESSTYYFRNFTFHGVWKNDTTTNVSPSYIFTISRSQVYVASCTFKAVIEETVVNSRMYLHLISLNDGSRFSNIYNSLNKGNQFLVTNNSTVITNIVCFYVGTNSLIQFNTNNSSAYAKSLGIRIVGSFNVILRVDNAMFINTNSRTSNTYFYNEDGDVVEGTRYWVLNGGSINTGGEGTEWIPGTRAGTVDESTYSWYK